MSTATLMQEVDEGVRDRLGSGEVVVRTIRMHREWLVITSRRLLMFSSTRRGHPQELLLDEPLQRLEASVHWRWSKLERVMVIRRTTGGVWRVALPFFGVKQSRNRALHEIVHDIQHWTRVAAVTAERETSGGAPNLGLAHLQVTALEAVTPAQFARDLGLEPRHIRDVLERRFGIHVSKGAALKYTYTRRDRRQFTEDVKQKLFALLIEEFGEEGIVERGAALGEQWWETSFGKTAEAVLEFFDAEAAHVSARRRPIPRWQSWMMWVGFAGAVITAILVIPPLIWASSWNRWRDGTSERPSAAIGLGFATIAALAALLVFTWS